MREPAQHTRRDAITLPQFCGLPAVFTLLVVGELVVLIAALAPDSHMGFRTFSTASAFVVWLALLCALALCKAMTWFAHWPVRTGYLAACAMLVLIVAVASALVGWRQGSHRRDRLRAVGRDLLTLAAGAAMLLVWAGIVEAFLSQYHQPVVPYALKIAFGLVELTGLIGYLGWTGRK